MNSLPSWTRRDNFRVAPHQRLVDKVNELANVTAGTGGEVVRSPMGAGVFFPEDSYQRVVRFHVTEILSPTAFPSLIKAKGWDGENELGEEVVIRTHRIGLAVDDELLAVQPVGGVRSINPGEAVEYDDAPVTWEELDAESDTCWALLGTEVHPGVFEWDEAYRETASGDGHYVGGGGGTIQAKTGGRSGDNTRTGDEQLAYSLTEIALNQGSRGWSSGAFVLLRRMSELQNNGEPDEGSYRTQWYIVSPPPGIPLIVSVTQVGGSSGAWTYDVTAWENSSGTYATWATGVTPLAGSESAFEFASSFSILPGDVGIGLFTGDGNFTLIWVNEKIDASTMIADGNYPLTGGGSIDISNGFISAINP